MAYFVVYPFGRVTVSVPASSKIAALSNQPARLYTLAGYPNQPNAQVDLATLTAGIPYQSAAFSSATTVVIEAGPSRVDYEIGTDAIVDPAYATQYQATPVALNATGALTAAAMLGGIVTSTTAAAVAGTIPTGTAMDAASTFSVGDSFDWSVINTGPNTFTVTAATAHTIVGAAAVATATSGYFRTLKTAANTFVTYRMS